ncbi:hypothetical protein L3X38_006188 [Prunus dulcis]|uniref:Uncharacterized protein n=1 Tax=Prunus dulcis TaxID=3755 RepID=A0AAD4ZSB6_PRUDU|nr:hypothetical protein L3X38_006188 [Prunus dulcis]
MPLGPMHNTLLDPRSQVDFNSRVDQLTQKVDDQNNLIGQLLKQINLNQGPNLGPSDKERRAHQHAGEQFKRSQAEPRTNVLERLGPQSNVHANLGPQGARVREQPREECNDQRPPTRSRANTLRQAVEESSQAQSPNLPHEQGTQGDRPLGTEKGVSQPRSRHQRRQPERPSLRAEDDDQRPPTCSRTNTRRQDVEESSQAQSPNLPHGQNTQGDRPLGTEEEVSQPRSRHRRRRPETPVLRAEDVEKLVNDRLQALQLKGSTEEAMHKEIDRVDCSPFTDKVERAPPPKRFTAPSITPFKGDSDPESHLRHFKSARSCTRQTMP